MTLIYIDELQELEEEIKKRFDFQRNPNCVSELDNKKRRNIKEMIFFRDGYKCVYCGKKAETIDHIKPYAYGGKNRLTNLISCCFRCNHKKDAKKVIHFIDKYFFSQRRNIYKRILYLTNIKYNRFLWAIFTIKNNKFNNISDETLITRNFTFPSLDY